MTWRREDEKDGGRRGYVEQSGRERGRGLVVDVVIGSATCSRGEGWQMRRLGGSLGSLISVRLERGRAGVQEVDKGRRGPKR